MSFDPPPTGRVIADPLDVISPAKRWGRRRTLATALIALVLIAALIAHDRLRGPENTTLVVAAPSTAATSETVSPPTTPGTAAPHATPTPATSAPPTVKNLPGARPPATQKTRWRPNAGLSWQWQLSGTVDQSVDAAVYDIDLSENDASVVRSLHAAGRRVICYIDVGGWEDYRSDAAKFPASVKGNEIDGWPSERWLDIRQLDVLRPIMAARFDLCAQRGFDGVEPDLMDAASDDSGFPLTAADQLKYNMMIADLGHERGLAVGLKNDLTQIPQLVSHFEFAVNEQCAEYSECALLVPFIAAGKPVFHAEYDVPTTVFCAQTTRLGFSSIRKKLDLGAWRETCKPR